MPPSDLVSPNAIIPALKVNGKKQALQEIAAKAAARGLWQAIFWAAVGGWILLILFTFAATNVDFINNVQGNNPYGAGYVVGIFSSNLWAITQTLAGPAFCCSRRKAPAPIISRRWRVSRVCSAIPRSPASSATRAMRMRSTPCWRCRLPARPSAAAPCSFAATLQN